MIKITNIKIRADLSDDELFEKIYKKYKINKNDVTERRIEKESGMTLAAMLRTIPKEPEKAANPLLEALNSG